MTLLWTVFAFFLGAIPFSVLVGRLVVGRNIQAYGDHNPGATNVLRAGGFLPFSLALFLDVAKAAFPVGFAYYLLGIQDWWIVPIALAPPLGHAYSPFLRGKGGKAIAATLGVWIGLTIWVIPVVGIILLVIWSLLVRPSGWALLLALGGCWIFFLFWQPYPPFLATFAGHTALLAWKHRADLGQRPRRRPFAGKKEEGA